MNISICVKYCGKHSVISPEALQNLYKTKFPLLSYIHTNSNGNNHSNVNTKH